MTHGRLGNVRLSWKFKLVDHFSNFFFILIWTIKLTCKLLISLFKHWLLVTRMKLEKHQVAYLVFIVSPFRIFSFFILLFASCIAFELSKQSISRSKTLFYFMYWTIAFIIMLNRWQQSLWRHDKLYYTRIQPMEEKNTTYEDALYAKH